MVYRRLHLRRTLTVITSFVIGIIWLIIFFFVPPDHIATVFLFWATTLLLTFRLSSLIVSKKRSVLITIGLGSLMLLNYYQVGNWLVGVLILGVLITMDYYLSSR